MEKFKRAFLFFVDVILYRRFIVREKIGRRKQQQRKTVDDGKNLLDTYISMQGAQRYYSSFCIHCVERWTAGLNTKLRRVGAVRQQPEKAVFAWRHKCPFAWIGMQSLSVVLHIGDTVHNFLLLRLWNKFIRSKSNFHFFHICLGLYWLLLYLMHVALTLHCSVTTDIRINSILGQYSPAQRRRSKFVHPEFDVGFSPLTLPILRIYIFLFDYIKTPFRQQRGY